MSDRWLNALLVVLAIILFTIGTAMWLWLIRSRVG
jgi:nitrogen fixation-related uncharacterized protein